MQQNIAVFEFEELAVRISDREGCPWFVLVDVCRALEIENSRHAASRLDADEKDGVVTNDAIGREQRYTIINESGLYSLILTSRKAAAKRFKKWVTAEVLPSIRRTGQYRATPQPEIIDTPADPIAALGRDRFHDWLDMIREARMTGGKGAALHLWRGSPLPQFPVTDEDRRSAPAVEATDTVGDFVAERLRGCRGAMVGRSAVYDAFCDFARKSGSSPVDRTSFGMALRHHIAVGSARRSDGTGSRGWFYTGIELLPETMESVA